MDTVYLLFGPFGGKPRLREDLHGGQTGFSARY